MKRKEAIGTIRAARRLAAKTHGFMAITNDETGETYRVDMPNMLAISRGVMSWACDLLETGEDLEAEEAYQLMLVSVARSLEGQLCGSESLR